MRNMLLLRFHIIKINIILVFRCSLHYGKLIIMSANESVHTLQRNYLVNNFGILCIGSTCSICICNWQNVLGTHHAWWVVRHNC